MASEYVGVVADTGWLFLVTAATSGAVEVADIAVHVDAESVAAFQVVGL